MKLQLLFFGIVSDVLKTSSLEIELANTCSVQHLKAQLVAMYPVLKNMDSYAIAVNETYATDTTTLQENDVVAIIPPVSGG
ncbi:MAG: molybdopterin converting factor subunit 1 [Polaribacter sp.]|nr:molybdopterin converting factor subunit 1 [Polaribacter sp.]